MEDKKPNIDELKMIQSNIARMDSNSFKIKGWAITLIVGTLILKSNSLSILIAIIPLMVFWILDAIYLQNERRFRDLYSKIVNGKIEESYVELSLDISAVKTQKFVKIMFSKTIGLLYGLIGILIVIYFLFDFFAVIPTS